jgi:hypothetical protein
MAIRARILPRFPIAISGGGGITVERQNGTLIIYPSAELAAAVEAVAHIEEDVAAAEAAAAAAAQSATDAQEAADDAEQALEDIESLIDFDNAPNVPYRARYDKIVTNAPGVVFSDFDYFPDLAFDGGTNRTTDDCAQKTGTDPKALLGFTYDTAQIVSEIRVYGSRNEGFVTEGDVADITISAYGFASGDAPEDITEAEGGTLIGSVGPFTDTSNESAGRDLTMSVVGSWKHVAIVIERSDTAGSFAVAEVVITDGVIFGDFTTQQRNAFDGNRDQNSSSAAQQSGSALQAYLGKTFTAPKYMARVQCYGANNAGFVSGNDASNITVDVYGFTDIQSAPTSVSEVISDGTLIGSTGPVADTSTAAPIEVITQENEGPWKHVAVLFTRTSSTGNWRVAEIDFFERLFLSDTYAISLPATIRAGRVRGAEDVGIKFDGGTFDDDAWDTFIDNVNSERIEGYLALPFGQSRIATKRETVLKRLVLEGRDPELCSIFMDSTAGTTGTFFQIGGHEIFERNDSGIFFKGFRLENGNFTSLATTSTENQLNFYNCANCIIDNMRFTRGAGIASFGDENNLPTPSGNDQPSGGTPVNRIFFNNIRGTPYAPTGGTAFDVRNGASDISVRFSKFSTINQSAAHPSWKFLWIHPKSIYGNSPHPTLGEPNPRVDPLKFIEIELNLPNGIVQYACVIDISHGSLHNTLFQNVIIDHADLACWLIQSTDAVDKWTSGRLSNVLWLNPRCTTSGIDFHFKNNDGRVMRGLKIESGQVRSGTVTVVDPPSVTTNPNIVLEGTAPIELHIGGGIELAQQQTPAEARPCIRASVGGWRLDGARLGVTENQSSRHSYVVEFADDCPDVIIDNVDARIATIGDIDNQGLTAARLDDVLIGKILAPQNFGVFKTTVEANGTPNTATVAQFSPPTNSMTQYTVDVMVRRSTVDASNNCLYRTTALVRRATGNAIVVDDDGAVAILGTEEGSLAWVDNADASVRLVFTGDETQDLVVTSSLFAKKSF